MKYELSGNGKSVSFLSRKAHKSDCHRTDTIPPIIKRVLGLEGVKEVHLCKEKIDIVRVDGYQWDQLLEQIAVIVDDGALSTETLTEKANKIMVDDFYRKIASIIHDDRTANIYVGEYLYSKFKPPGYMFSQLYQDLMDIPGIKGVNYDRYSVYITKSPSCVWREVLAELICIVSRNIY